MRPTCPTCKRVIDGDPSPWRPFCSSRCRMADLGSWLAGSYRISSPASEEDLDQGGPSDDGNRDGDRGDGEPSGTPHTN